MNDINAIQEWLKNQRNIPKKKNRKETFLDFAGQIRTKTIWKDGTL